MRKYVWEFWHKEYFGNGKTGIYADCGLFLFEIPEALADHVVGAHNAALTKEQAKC